MKRYHIYQVHDNPGWDYDEDDNGEWCKADEAIAGMESIAADLAVAQLRIAELEQKLKISESNFENLCYDIHHDGFEQ